MHNRAQIRMIAQYLATLGAPAGQYRVGLRVRSRAQKADSRCTVKAVGEPCPPEALPHPRPGALKTAIWRRHT
jgi:hypothetical protein